MKCPRCGLHFFRYIDNGSWMCMACGHVLFDGQWLAAAVITGCTLALIFAKAAGLIVPILLLF